MKGIVEEHHEWKSKQEISPPEKTIAEGRKGLVSRYQGKRSKRCRTEYEAADDVTHQDIINGLVFAFMAGSTHDTSLSSPVFISRTTYLGFAGVAAFGVISSNVCNAGASVLDCSLSTMNCCMEVLRLHGCGDVNDAAEAISSNTVSRRIIVN